MQELHQFDLDRVVGRLPQVLQKKLGEHPGQLFVCGGMIRSIITREKISDIDVIASSPELAKKVAEDLSTQEDTFTTENAYTLRNFRPVIQIIHRWTYDDPTKLLESFDFVIARAVVWWDGSEWRSMCDPRYYQDLAARRLTYCRPIREEAPGGSMLRLLKFYSRGYTADLQSIAYLIERVSRPEGLPKIGYSESRQAVLIESRLVEVDPRSLLPNAMDPNSENDSDGD
jgi:hypothetical protein